MITSDKCADCGGKIGEDIGPPDGWQLEDGRTVCHSCCVVDTKTWLSSNNARAAACDLRDAWLKCVLSMAYALRIDRALSWAAGFIRKFSA